MRRLLHVCLVTLAVAASATPARAQRLPFDRTIDVMPGATLDIATMRGKVYVNVHEARQFKIEGTVTVRAELDGDNVVVRISDTGSWRAPRGQGRGRGTLIMQTTTDDFRVDRRPDGTDVILRRHLTR